MISPELLRRYPFFANLTDDELRQIAMLSAEESIPSGQALFKEKQTADSLFLLLDGGMDLYFHVQGEGSSSPTKEFFVGEINPGEAFGVSGIIEPYLYTSTARASRPGRVIRIDAEALRGLFSENPILGFKFMQQVAKTTLERLSAARVQLAAAWA